MNIVDKVISAVTPNPTDAQLQEARAQARALAGKGGWLSAILDHHEQIEACFAAVSSATSESGRKKALKQLALMLTGHSVAEESVIYPALASHDQIGGSDELYSQQSTAKVDMAALDELEPTSQDFLDKLESIRGAVAQHVYAEESNYLPKLKAVADSALHARLSRKYREEFERYVRPAD